MPADASPTARAPDDPRLARARGLLDEGELGEFTREGVVRCGRVDDLSAAGEDLAMGTWRELSIVRGRLAGADLTRAELADTSLESCDLVGAELRGVSLHRVRAADTRMAGAGLLEATLRDVRLERCQLDGARLRGARLERVVFSDCSLDGVDLTDARLESVVFDGCDLSRARLFGTRFVRCELRGCTLDELQDLASLEGVAMPLLDVVEHAATIARLLGVHVLAGDGDHGDG